MYKRQLLHIVDVSSFKAENIIKNINDINAELELFGSDLAQKEQWIVINKNDLDLSKEEIIRKEIKEEFKEQRIFSISAITGKGLENLVSEIGTKVFSLD